MSLAGLREVLSSECLIPDFNYIGQST